MQNPTTTYNNIPAYLLAYLLALIPACIPAFLLAYLQMQHVYIQNPTTTYNSIPAYLLACQQMQRTRMSDLPMLMTNASKQARKPESYVGGELLA